MVGSGSAVPADICLCKYEPVRGGPELHSSFWQTVGPGKTRYLNTDSDRGIFTIPFQQSGFASRICNAASGTPLNAHDMSTALGRRSCSWRHHKLVVVSSCCTACIGEVRRILRDEDAQSQCGCGQHSSHHFRHPDEGDASRLHTHMMLSCGWHPGWLMMCSTRLEGYPME